MNFIKTSVSILLTIIVLLGCSGDAEHSLENQIIGSWTTSSFSVKDYSSNQEDQGQAFLDGVKIAHLQMFFKENEKVTFTEEGKANFHGNTVDYKLENDNQITFTSTEFGDMHLIFDLSVDEDGNLIFLHELGSAILIPVK